jgi:Family of unknown function (DUF5684)
MNPFESLVGAYLGVLIVIGVIALLLTILQVICFWILYDKAGQPGWAAIIPVYATIIKLKVAGKPVSWVIWFMQYYVFYILWVGTREPVALLLYFFSLIANLVFYILVLNGISKSFGKDQGWTVGLFFLPFVFFPILAFGDSKYVGPGGVANNADPLL